MRNRLAEKEIEIGKRLRAFRESLKIPRTSFALQIGVGSERQATYEAGRVPLRWETFMAISKCYFLNPVWLATGQGEPSMQVAFDDARFQSVLRPRMLFSEAVDAIMKQAGPPGLLALQHKIMQCGRMAAEIQATLPNIDVAPEVLASVNKFVESFGDVLMAMQTEYQQNQARRDVVKLAISPRKKVQNNR